ncbi:MAG: hypothetical protein IJC63_04960 [Myxococcaceae bacterium]|nr:hypothetical protein [Myxococcaceae bacterium]
MSRTLKLLSSLALSLCLAFGALGCGGEETGDLTLSFTCWDGYSAAPDYCHLYDLNSDSITVRLFDANGYEVATEVLWWTEGSTITFLDLPASEYGYDAYVYSADGTLLYENDGTDEYGYYYSLTVLEGQNNKYVIELIRP